MTFKLAAVVVPAGRTRRPTRGQPRKIRFAERERLILEALEGRRVLAAVPTVAFVNDPPASATDPSSHLLVADPLIGTKNTFTLRFDNVGTTSADVGYAPYIDLFMPVTGKDGVAPGTPTPQNAYDGIDLVDATYIGRPLKQTAVTLTADPAGVPHPFAKDGSGNPRILRLSDYPGAKAGDKVYVLELPLGSYTPSQPPVDIVVTTQVSNLADVGASLPIIARGGFRYGSDPLDNPTVDPPIVGTAATQAFTPALYHVTKENLAPEYETATGPNFKQHYRIRVDVAPGQTLANLRLKDVLPNTLQFVGATVTGDGSLGSVTDVFTPSTTAPGGTLERLLASVAGLDPDSASDAVLDIEYYVPYRDLGGSTVINPTTGDDVVIPNSATASDASWTPLDPRDSPVNLPPVTVPTTGPLGVWDPQAERPLVAKSIATQKSVSGTATPGSVLTYTINFQVSDYFAFNNLVLKDLLGDGQSYVAGSATLTVTDGHIGTTAAAAFAGANVTVTPNKTGQNGKDELEFRISQELKTRSFSSGGRLVGGFVPAAGGAVPGANVGSTTGQITFQARVQDLYDGTVASGNKQIVPNDLLDNRATISGSILSNANLTTNIGSESDDTYAWTRVPQTSFTKSVYAKNGVTGSYDAATLVAVGDTITYRIRYTLPNSSFENLKLNDYLPLPLFNVGEVGSAITAFDAAASGTGVPSAGKWTYGPADTFHSLASPAPPSGRPSVSNDVTANGVVFDFGTFDDTQNRQSEIDILFTVTASSQPFADGLRLANRATSSANNSSLDAERREDIAEVTSSAPDLRIKKGIVATDLTATGAKYSPLTKGPVPFNAPGSPSAFTGTITSAGLAAKPIDSNLSGVDNGDLVTYVIVVENRGSGRYGAFDVLIKDQLPVGVTIPSSGLNLRVTNGAGNSLSYTTLGTGLFDGGIRLDDPSASQGALARGIGEDGVTVTSDGSNIAIIAFDALVLDNTAKAKLTNIGEVENYAAKEGGPDFTGTGSLTDTAVITIGGDLLAKELVTTSIVPGSFGDLTGNNSLTEAVVGEFVTYKVTITVPEARMPNAVITDTLDDGLAFVNLVSVVASPKVGYSTPVPSVSNGGRTVAFNLGTITNADTDNAVTEKIELVYRAVVTNKSVVQGGVKLSNSATLRFSDATTTYSETRRAAPITIIEPQVVVAKTAMFTSGSGSGTTTGEANDNVSYTITISNPSGAQASTADAYDLTFSDVLPQAILNASLVSVTGASASLFELVGGTLRTKAGATFDLGVNATPIVLTVTGTLAVSVASGDVISNTATAQWTSLDGDPGLLSPWSPDATERTGSLSPAHNDYRASSTADLKVKEIGLKKSLVATSETGNGVSSATRVVPGEIVRWRLVTTLPGSTVARTSAQIVDQLPAGMQFLNDGTAKAAIVSTAVGGVTSSRYPTAGSSGLYVTGATDVGVTPTFVIPGANILGGPFGSGTTVSFDFGGLVNNEGSDGDDEYAIVEFNALVLNVSTNGVTNGVGNNLDNRMRVRRDGVLGTQSSTSRVTVSEGMFESATKTAVSQDDDVTPVDGPFDAGDSVRYRIDVAAAAGVARATLFDVVLADPMPAGASLNTSSVRVFRNGSQITTGFVNASTAAGVALTFDRVDPGDTITVLYDTTLATSVAAGTAIPNTVTVTGTSLPGPRGTTSNPTGSATPGASGSTTGERDGSGGAINKYRITAGTSVLIATPTIDKTLVEASPVETTYAQFDPARPDFAIGEIATYRITVTVPEGVTPSLIISDLLPESGRMQLFSSGGVVQTRVVSVGSNIQGALLDAGKPGVVTGGGRTTTFNFGTVTNLPDNVTDEKDQIVVEVEAQVMNVAANKAGGTLTNTGLLSYRVNGATRTASDTVTADIVEPVLETSKQVRKDGTAATGAVDLLRVDVGDTLIYRVTVRHAPSSTGPAYSVRIADTLPAGLALDLGSVRVIQHPDYQSSFYDQPVVTQSGNGFSVLIDYIDQPDGVFAIGGDGDVAVIEYKATVTSALTGSITNTAVVTYDSLYGERSSVISPTTTRDYRGSDPATVVVAKNTISGYVYVDMNNDGVRGPGEAPIAGVPIRLSGTTLTGQPVVLNTTTDASGFYFFAGMAPGTYTITQVAQPAGYADGKDTVGTEFMTGSPLALSGPDRFTQIVIPNNASTQDGVEWNFGERMETDLAITKTDGTSIFTPDKNVTYTITVTNNGIWGVVGAVVSDSAPAGTTAVGWRLVGVEGVGGVTSGTPAKGSSDLDARLDLAPGAKATFEFTVNVPSGFTDRRLVNRATVMQPDGWVDKTPGDNTATDIDSRQVLVIGSDTGCSSVALVRVIDPDTGLDLISPIQPYESNFRGGVRVTTGDVDGDGSDDIIVAPGPGRPGEVKVYKQDGTPMPAYTSFPFGAGYNRGLEVASANMDGVGADDLIVSANGEVRTYLWQGGAQPFSPTPATSFRPFGPGYTGSVSVAAGDFGRLAGGAFTPNPDGRFEIVTGTGMGARAFVRIFDVTGAPTQVRQIQPIGPSVTGGVSVATTRYKTSSLPDDGIDDVIVGAGSGGGSVVEVYSGSDGSRLARNMAFANLPRQQAAVHAAALADASGNTDVFAVQGSGGFTSTNGIRRLSGSLLGTQTQLNSLAAPLRIAAIKK